MTRTPDRRIRNPLLYPAELRAQKIAVQYVALGREKIQGECDPSSRLDLSDELVATDKRVVRWL